MKDIYDLIGRICISIIFIYEALDTLFFFQNTKDTMTAYGVTWQQDFLLVGAIAVLIIGATMVLIGYYANIGAFLLLLYWLPFTVIVYSFWNDPPEYQRLSSLYFMRNVAVCGGLLILMANGSGKFSVRRLIHNLRLPE
jgi:putative oxidoreductase